MDQNCSQMPNTDVGNESPSNKPRLDFGEVGKLSPSDRAESPDTNCAICLGKLQNKSFTDSCLHQFCFTCLLEWSKVKAECPLCKQSFKSIIHNVRSIEDYDQYHLRPAEPRLGLQNYSFLMDENQPHRPSFRYRTTMSPLYGFLHRLEHVVANRAHVVDHLIPPGCTIIPAHRSMHWHSNGSRLDVIHWGTSNDRRNIYRQGLWVRRVPDITGRFRECTPEFFANNPAQLHRLVPWLNRELNVLLAGTGYASELVITRILDLVTRFPIQGWDFRNRVQRYFGSRTGHFIHEFYAFGTSPYDMIGYDRNSIYGAPSTAAQDETDNESDSADSDVQIVDVVVRPQGDSAPVIDVAFSNDLTRDGSPVPGPSGVVNNQEGITITSESECDPEECMIVGTVKPRHLRTPEVITLDDDDDDDNNNTDVKFNETNNTLRDMYEHISSEEDFKPIITRDVSSSSRRKSSDSCKASTSRRDPAKKSSARRAKPKFLSAATISTSDSESSDLSTTSTSSGEQWGYSNKGKKKCVKKKKRTSTSSKKKAKESKKKKSSKEKKNNPLKHWKKKLCVESDSSSSSYDDFSKLRRPMKRQRLPSTTSASSSHLQDDHNQDFLNPSRSKRLRHGTSSSSSSSRLRSVVHVRRETQESNDSYSASTSSRTRSYDCDSWLSASSSHHGGAHTASSAPHHHAPQSRAVAETAERPSSPASTCKSSSSSSSMSSSNSWYQRKYKYRRTKSKRKYSN